MREERGKPRDGNPLSTLKLTRYRVAVYVNTYIWVFLLYMASLGLVLLPSFSSLGLAACLDCSARKGGSVTSLRIYYLRCIYYVFTTYLLRIYDVFTMYLRCIYYVFTTYLLRIYDVSTTYLRCTYYVFTMYLLRDSLEIRSCL